jgi:hypothetical protein
MKNDIVVILQARQSPQNHKAKVIDIVLTPKAVRPVASQPRPIQRRRVDYAKKIMNDPLIFNA